MFRKNLARRDDNVRFCTVLATTTNRSSIDQITADAKIDILSDEALLEIFSCYLAEEADSRAHDWRWLTLVHVCRRWRTIVFESPCRLDLRIPCTGRSRVKEMLDIWPVLPIDVWAAGGIAVSRSGDVDNIVAALKHNDRVRRIWVESAGSVFSESIATVIQEPLPALTHLHMASWEESVPAVFPETFLGGSAPHLRYLSLDGIAFPGIQKLLLTANHLVRLQLIYVPLSGYISPEAMATCLSVLPNLERLSLEFTDFPFPGRLDRHPPPLSRVFLPSLTHFVLTGAIEYIEDLVSRIDAPLLDHAYITFFGQLAFVTPRLHDFLARTDAFAARSHAAVQFDPGSQVVTFELKPGFLLQIKYARAESQLSSIALTCSSSLRPFSTLERLDICQFDPKEQHWPVDMENSQWLELLRPLTALKDLYLGKPEELALRIVSALQELAERGTAEHLPTLQNVFIEGLQPSGPLQGVIMQFVAARQLSGHPVAVHRWEREP